MTPDSLLPVPESASECENVSSHDLLAAVVNDYNADIEENNENDEENENENDNDNDNENDNENENEGLSPADNYLSTKVSPPSQPSPASPSSPAPQSFLSSLLPYIPATYSWRRDLLVDVIAGVSVAAMMVPQSISFITLSDLPLNFGLHATLIAAFSYSVLGGRSNHMSLGNSALKILYKLTFNPYRSICCECVYHETGCSKCLGFRGSKYREERSLVY
jgi:hypothetical protein